MKEFKNEFSWSASQDYTIGKLHNSYNSNELKSKKKGEECDVGIQTKPIRFYLFNDQHNLFYKSK